MQFNVFLPCLLVSVTAKQNLLDVASTRLDGNNGNNNDISGLDSIRAIAKRDADKNEDVRNNLLRAIGAVLKNTDKDGDGSISKEDVKQIREDILDALLQSFKQTVLDAVFTSLAGNAGNYINSIGLESSAVTHFYWFLSVARAADKNEDGKVTKEEFEQISEDILDAHFQPPKQTVLDAAFTSLGGNTGNDIDISGLDPVRAIAARVADENADGKVTKEEFMKISVDILDAYIQLYDINRDGYVYLGELMEGGVTLNGFLSFIKIAFKAADTNRDGFISTAYYMDIVLTEVTTALVQPLMKTIIFFDRDLDGQVSLEDINNFVKTFWKITDKNESGHISINETFLMLKQNGLSDELAAEWKKVMSKYQNISKIMFIEIVKKINEDGGRHIGHDEMLAVLNKPKFDLKIGHEEIISINEEVLDLVYKNHMEVKLITNILDSILDETKFS